MDACKKFLKDYTVELMQSESTEENAVHPKIVSNYCISKEEVYNHVVDWVLHYLESKNCPYQLAELIAKVTARQIDAGISEQLPDGNLDKVLSSHALYAQTLKRISTWCLSLSENTDELDCASPLSFVTSSFEIKNKRRTMEDRRVIIHDLNSLLDLKDVAPHSYYAVFDGHSGVDAASYASAHLHVNLAKHPDFVTDTPTAIAESYKMTDDNFLKKSEEENLKSGCTAVCALIREKRIYLSWAGDAQAVLVKGGRAAFVSEPHKPDRPDERQRVEDVGGCVTSIMGVSRVNGMLAITRALGDADYRPYISSEPEMETIDLDGSEDFLVLACDGLFDGMTPEEVTSSLYRNMSESSADEPLETLAAKLTHKAKEQGSEDNISTIVVFLRDVGAIREYANELLAHGSVHNDFLGMNGGGEKHPDKPTVLELNAASAKKLKNTANVLSSAGFQCPPVYSEGGFDGSMFQNEDFAQRPNLPACFAPEATALSELPTPPIDDVVAAQQFGNICPTELLEGLKSISTEQVALNEDEANAFNSGDFESMVNVQLPTSDQIILGTLVDVPSDFQSMVIPPQDQTSPVLVDFESVADQLSPVTSEQPANMDEFESLVKPLPEQISSEPLVETSSNKDFTPDEAANIASCIVSNTIETAVRCLSSNNEFVSWPDPEPDTLVSPTSQLNPFAKPFVPGGVQLQSEPETVTLQENVPEIVSSHFETTEASENRIDLSPENNVPEQTLDGFSKETVVDASIKNNLAEEKPETSSNLEVFQFNEDNGSKTLRVSSLTSRFSAMSIISPQLQTEDSVFRQSNIQVADNLKEDNAMEIESPVKTSKDSLFSQPENFPMADNPKEDNAEEIKFSVEASDIFSQLQNIQAADNFKENNAVEVKSAKTTEDSVFSRPESIPVADNLKEDNATEIKSPAKTSEDLIFSQPPNIQVADNPKEDNAMETESSVKTSDAGFSLESVTFESLNLVGVEPEAASSDGKLAEEAVIEAVDLQTVPVGVPEAEGVSEDVDSDSEKDGGWSYVKGNTVGKSKADEQKPKADKSGVAPKLKKDVAKATLDNKSKVRSMTATDKAKKPLVDKKVLAVKEKVKPTRTVSSTLPRDASKSTLSRDASKPTLARDVSKTTSTLLSAVARGKKEGTTTVPGSKTATASSTQPKTLGTKSVVDKSAKPTSTFSRIKKETSSTLPGSKAPAAAAKPSRPTTLRNPISAPKAPVPTAKDRVLSASVKTTTSTTARPKSALATVPQNGVKLPKPGPTLPRAQPPSLQSKATSATSNRSTTLNRPVSSTLPARVASRPSKPVESKLKPTEAVVKKPDVKTAKDIANKQARKNLTASSTLVRKESTKTTTTTTTTLTRSATTTNKTLSNKPVASKILGVPSKSKANNKNVPSGSKNASNLLKSSTVEKGVDEKAPTIDEKSSESATPVDSSSEVVTPSSEEEKFRSEVNNKEVIQSSVQEKEKDDQEKEKVDEKHSCLENGVGEENAKPLEEIYPAANQIESSPQEV